MGVWNFGAHYKGAYVTSPQFKKKKKNLGAESPVFFLGIVHIWSWSFCCWGN